MLERCRELATRRLTIEQPEAMAEQSRKRCEPGERDRTRYGADTARDHGAAEQLGGDGPFSCEIEITPDGITTWQCGAETKRPWSAVKEINETSDALEFFWCTGGLLAVRNRAFQTPESCSDFLRKSKKFLAESTHRHQN